MIKEIIAVTTAFQVVPVVDRYRSIKSSQRYRTFVVQLLLPIREGHSHGNKLPNHQQRVRLTEVKKKIKQRDRTQQTN